MDALSHKGVNCWERYASEKDRRDMDSLAVGYLEFLSQCKTERETVAWIMDQAGARGFS
ncbi:MAG: aminopeptidase, partial [Deltaproteobacteria bacterium]|nr:aminopeptidase [Deltaproteobacteria bacterium]